MAGKETPAALKAGERFIPYRLFNGVFIPNVLLETDLISPVDKIVWGRLCQFAGENGICFPSFSTIATKTGISRSGAIKSVHSLVEKGFLEKQVPNAAALGRQCSNRYYFLLHPLFFEAFMPPSAQSVLGAEPSTQNQLALVHSVDQPSSQSRPEEIHKENQENTTTTTIMPAQGNSCSLMADGGCGGLLSVEDQKRYIALKVEHTAACGRLRSKKSLEKYLSLQAKVGKLDTSDFLELEKWKSELSGQSPMPVCVVRQGDKDALHAKLSKDEKEVDAWWHAQDSTHPAKIENKPEYCPDNIWRRQQFKKYALPVQPAKSF